MKPNTRLAAGMALVVVLGLVAFVRFPGGRESGETLTGSARPLDSHVREASMGQAAESALTGVPVLESERAQDQATPMTPTKPESTESGARPTSGLGDTENPWYEAQSVSELLLAGSVQVDELAELASQLVRGTEPRITKYDEEGVPYFELLRDEEFGVAKLYVKPGLLGKPGEFTFALEMKDSPGGWNPGETEGSSLSLGFDFDEENRPLGCRAFLQATNPVLGSRSPSPPPDHGAGLTVNADGATWQRVRTLTSPQGISIDAPTAVYAGQLGSPHMNQLGELLGSLRGR